jgi:putative thioredoxin
VESPFVLDVTAGNFEKEVLDASREVPVIVDFWAPWCAPCRTLGPMLEKLAVEYGGRFRLVKVDTEANPEIGQAFNIRSIPDVRAFRGGQQVDQFMGALPEGQLRAFIDRVVPAPAELERLRGNELLIGGDLPGALAALRKAVELAPASELSRVDLADALIAAGQHEEAAPHLEQIPPNLQLDARVAALKQAIGFARGGGNEADLVRKVAANPSDLEARLALAGALASRKAWREAMDQLLEIVRRDKGWRDGEARKQMVAVFNLAGDAALVSEYRRKLAGLLH